MKYIVEGKKVAGGVVIDKRTYLDKDGSVYEFDNIDKALRVCYKMNMSEDGMFWQPKRIED